MQKAQVDVGQARPGQRAVSQQVVKNEVIDRHRDRQHHYHRHTQTRCSSNFFRYCKEGTHAKEKRQGHVFNEDGPHKEAEIVLHYALSSAGLWWTILKSGSSTCSVFTARIAQINRPIRKKALGGSNNRPLA